MGGSVEDIDFADCFFDFVYFCVAEAFNFGEIAFCGCLDGIDGANAGGLEFGNVRRANSWNQPESEEGLHQSFGARRHLRSPWSQTDGETDGGTSSECVIV